MPGTLGEDAIIRFLKDPRVFCGWKGEEKTLLNFTAHLAHRYPVEAHDFNLLSERVDCVTGGSGSREAFTNCIGFLSYEEQIQRYQNHRAYINVSGLVYPYTLSFVEAWMTGTPVVVLAPPDRVGPYFEIDRFVEDGVNGFICRDIDRAEECAKRLFADDELALRIGSAGRERAIELFGKPNLQEKWRNFFDQCSLSRS